MSQGKSLLLALTALLAWPGLVSCAPSSGFAQDDRIRVLATTGILADLAREIGGDQVQVLALMGPGVDPHYYRPTAGDIARISEAHIVLHHGLHLEGRMEAVFHNLPQAGKNQPPTKPQALDIGQSIPQTQLLQAEGGEPDPHVWHDPLLWADAARSLAETLAKNRPAQAHAFHQRAQTYAQKLHQTTSQAQAKIQQIPPEARVLVTAHDAFAYFGRRLGLEVHAIQGANTTSEAGTAALVQLADLVAKRKIKAIFVESSVSPATIHALQEAVKARGWQVQIGGELYSDALGPPDTPTETYLGMFQHNVRTVTEALR